MKHFSQPLWKNGGGNDRIVGFDLARIFSCICVAIVHFNASVSGWQNGVFVYPNSIIPNFYVDGRVYLGNIGVCLFFILSGASLMYTYRPGQKALFFKKRALSIYPMFWIAYLVATFYDFLLFKGMNSGNLIEMLFSFAGLDGYLCSAGAISFDFYKLGEWFLGCILILYLFFPLLHWGVEKHPAITVSVALLVYGIMVGRVSAWTFYLRIPEMLIGMLYVKYGWQKKPQLQFAIGAFVFLVAFLLRDHINSLTLSIAFCFLLLTVFVAFSALVRPLCRPSVEKALTFGSKLTYPIFLVHHWLISHMVMGFYLPTLPRRSVFMMFIIYVVLTVILSLLLLRAGDRVIYFLKKKKLI